mgnify:CR=1 FL=1
MKCKICGASPRYSCLHRLVVRQEELEIKYTKEPDCRSIHS